MPSPQLQIGAGYRLSAVVGVGYKRRVHICRTGNAINVLSGAFRMSPLTRRTPRIPATNTGFETHQGAH